MIAPVTPAGLGGGGPTWPPGESHHAGGHMGPPRQVIAKVDGNVRHNLIDELHRWVLEVVDVDFDMPIAAMGLP